VLLLCISCAPAAPPAKILDRVIPPQGEGRVTRLQAPTQVRLRGTRVEAKAGDFMLESGNMVAVVSAEDGMVLDFGPVGATDELISLTPALFDGLGNPRAPIAFIGAAEGQPGVLHIIRRGAALPVRLHTFVTFRGSLLVIESTAEPEDPKDDGMLVALGERVAWGNTPSWVEGQGLIRREGGTWSTRFIGRDGPNLWYGLATDGGPTGAPNVVRFGGAYLAGFFASGRGSEISVAQTGGRSPRRTLYLSASPRSLGDAMAQLIAPEALKTYAAPTGVPATGRVEIASCPDPKEIAEAKGKDTAKLDRKPFVRFAPGEPLRLPDGCFEVRLRAPGYKTTEWLPLERANELAIAPSGTLMVTMTEKGVRTPARLQVRGVSGTANPEWGEDPDNGAAMNVVDSRTGLATMPVPVGKYRVIVDRGFEYTVFDQTVEVTAGQTTTVAAEIERAIQTPGWVSADLHLHSEVSFDAPQSLEERVVSLVVAGVEVGVATDHNRVTDYRPVIERLGLQKYVASVIGDEVTTEEMGFGHFNIFPLEAGSEPIVYRRTSPGAIFDAARARAPYFKDNVIQVNHPRMGDIGYFDVLRLDRDRIQDLTGRAPWARLDFDAIELFNGDDATSVATVEGVMKDWYALLDAGYRITATGNSDSHRAIFHEPGLPRTYVRVPSDDVEKLDQRAFIDSVRKNRAIVSSGPFVTLKIDEAGIGDSVTPGLRRARVEVSAPRWMDISYVEIIQKGKPVARVEAPFEPTTFTAELEATLDLRPGDWVIATTGGTKEMDPLYRRGVPPYAFTNPIFVSP
jgi:hypothetical protein